MLKGDRLLAGKGSYLDWKAGWFGSYAQTGSDWLDLTMHRHAFIPTLFVPGYTLRGIEDR